MIFSTFDWNGVAWKAKNGDRTLPWLSSGCDCPGCVSLNCVACTAAPWGKFQSQWRRIGKEAFLSVERFVS